MIIISTEEIRTAGLFSSRDSAVIEKNTILKITLSKKRRINVELFGKRTAPDFSWSKTDQTGEPIRIFHEKAIGDVRAIKRILRYFGISEDDTNAVLKKDNFYKEYNFFNLSLLCDGENRQIVIEFTETI